MGYSNGIDNIHNHQTLDQACIQTIVTHGMNQDMIKCEARDAMRQAIHLSQLFLVTPQDGIEKQHADT
jgi:hypothetical protein